MLLGNDSFKLHNMEAEKRKKKYAVEEFYNSHHSRHEDSLRIVFTTLCSLKKSLLVWKFLCTNNDMILLYYLLFQIFE